MSSLSSPGRGWSRPRGTSTSVTSFPKRTLVTDAFTRQALHGGRSFGPRSGTGRAIVRNRNGSEIDSPRIRARRLLPGDTIPVLLLCWMSPMQEAQSVTLELERQGEGPAVPGADCSPPAFDSHLPFHLCMLGLALLYVLVTAIGM